VIAPATKDPLERGTTLLEVMIAVVVASIALVGIVTAALRAVDLEGYSRQLTQTTLLADRKLKEIESSDYPDVGASDGLFNEDDPNGYGYKIAVSESAIGDVREIDLDVVWDNGKRTLRFVSFVGTHKVAESAPPATP
jgi:Tfp pilus assembly protein PilV